MRVRDGVVIKGVGGFYEVCMQDGERLVCVPRGKLKRSGTIVPGDKVKVADAGHGRGTIEELLSRTTRLSRPSVANVDQVVIVASSRDPEPDLLLTDRILVLCEFEELGAVVCLNKADLASFETIQSFLRPYEKAGYPVLATVATQGLGVEELKALLAGKISVLAGPSGAGKSRLLNAVKPGAGLVTGEVSAKGRSGRHTTKHVELLVLESGGLVADSPGFSRLDVDPVSKSRLRSLFPEFREPAKSCRYNGCFHRHEPGCAVKECVENNRITRSRYSHYIEFLNEIELFEARRYQHQPTVPH